MKKFILAGFMAVMAGTFTFPATAAEAEEFPNMVGKTDSVAAASADNSSAATSTPADSTKSGASAAAVDSLANRQAEADMADNADTENEEQEESGGGFPLISWIALILGLGACGYCYMTSKNILGELRKQAQTRKSRGSELQTKLATLEAKNEELAKRVDTLSLQLNELSLKVDRQGNAVVVNSGLSRKKSEETAPHVSPKISRPDNKPEKPSVRFGYFSGLSDNGEGEMMLPIRFVKEDSSLMFKMEIKGEKATYTINPEASNVNLTTLKNVAKIQGGNGTKPNVVSPGTMILKDKNWRVEKMLEVTLT